MGRKSHIPFQDHADNYILLVSVMCLNSVAGLVTEKAKAAQIIIREKASPDIENYRNS